MLRQLLIWDLSAAELEVVEVVADPEVQDGNRWWHEEILMLCILWIEVNVGMLEDNTVRMILAIFTLVIAMGVILLAVYLLNGGADSVWSFLSWLHISDSSANI